MKDSWAAASRLTNQQKTLYDLPDIPQILRDLDCLVMGSGFPHPEGLADPAEFAALLGRVL
jgi:hypothetical protein